MFHRKSRWRATYNASVIVLLLLVLELLFSSCSDSPMVSGNATPIPTSASSIPIIPITAVDYAYIMPSTITVRAGLVDLAMVNNGSEAHQTQVARLNDGVTPDMVLNTLVIKKEQAAAFSLLTFVGGPDTVSPGYGQEAILNLSVGRYVLLCFVVGQDGIPHMNKGMIHFFTITSQQIPKDVPQTDAVITMRDFGYDLPNTISQARSLTIRIVNQGSESHEMNIVKLAQGKRVQDISSFFQLPSGPPPFEELGGMAALKAGGSGWIKIHLEPGNYAVFSFIPDVKTGKSQLSLGMITPFTVQ